MTSLSYAEALELCRKETDRLVSQKNLRSHCEKHNISYDGALGFLRGIRKKRNTQIVTQFLESVGYNSVDVEKTITYNFHFSGSAEEKLKAVNVIVQDTP